MKIQQFIKRLNNTEIGRGNTQDCYVLVPREVNIERMFDQNNRTPILFDKVSNKILDLGLPELTLARENRIKGLGPYYRENIVCAGDEILFEKREFENKVEFFIDLNIKQNIVMFQKNSKGFEILNFDRLEKDLINTQYVFAASYNNIIQPITIQFKESSKKRTDSPDTTDFYDIATKDGSILDKYKNNDYLELSDGPKTKLLSKVSAWQEYEFQF